MPLFLLAHWLRVSEELNLWIAVLNAAIPRGHGRLLEFSA